MQWFYWRGFFSILEIRARVGDEWGIEFIIHTKENGHHMPHLHAKYQDQEIVIEIATGKVLQGNIQKDKIKQATKWVIDHQEEMRERWNELTSSGIKLTHEFKIVNINHKS